MIKTKGFINKDARGQKAINIPGDTNIPPTQEKEHYKEAIHKNKWTNKGALGMWKAGSFKNLLAV